jgi:TRAP-type C4-dicarboxylate transport system substrate-binding protein
LDKAGGRPPPKARVLTLANGAGPVGTLQVFADEVERRSRGRLRIAFRSDWRKGEVDFEAGLIRDVQRGRADIGWSGTRAWDAVGVPSFDALHMPLLVDGLALEERVLESPLPGSMLRGLSPLGLVGLSVLPGPIRRPLSVARPMLGPADFAGRRIAMQASRVSRDTLRALGASPVAIPSAGAITGLDGLEQQIEAIYTNHYELHARYLAGNVGLWPRPLVLFMSRRRFESLGVADRRLLTAAATASVGPMLALQRRLDSRAASGLCRRGLVVARATPQDLAALARAVSPVYAAAEPATQAFVQAIRRIKARMAAPPDNVRPCPGAPPRVAAVIPDGDYTVTITSRDALRAGLPRRDDLAQVPRQQFKLELRAGGFTLYELRSRPPAAGFAGTFSVYRDRVVATGDNGDILHARWALTPGGLQFTDVRVPRAGRVNDYTVVWGTRAWRRTG